MRTWQAINTCSYYITVIISRKRSKGESMKIKVVHGSPLTVVFSVMNNEMLLQIGISGEPLLADETLEEFDAQMGYFVTFQVAFG